MLFVENFSILFGESLELLLLVPVTSDRYAFVDCAHFKVLLHRQNKYLTEKLTPTLTHLSQLSSPQYKNLNYSVKKSAICRCSFVDF